MIQSPRGQKVEGIISELKSLNKLSSVTGLLELIDLETTAYQFQCVNPPTGLLLEFGDNVKVINTQSTLVQVGDVLKLVSISESSLGLINPLLGQKLKLIKAIQKRHV